MNGCNWRDELINYSERMKVTAYFKETQYPQQILEVTS